MNRSIFLITGLLALGASACGSTTVADTGGDRPSSPASGACLEGSLEECGDQPLTIDPASGACLVGSTDCDDNPGDAPGDAMCPHGVTDCVDADVDAADARCRPEVVECADTADAFDVQAAIDRAHGLLGLAAEALPADVRVGRIGDEYQPVTEDYRLGRLTVAIDDTDGSGPRVVEVTVELPEGTAVYQLTAS